MVLSPLTTALVVVVWFLIRAQIKSFADALNSKVCMVDVEKILAEKIKTSEAWSGVTFVLSKLFDQYTVSAELNHTTLVKQVSDLASEVSRNRDSVISELQLGFAGVRVELTNIRKVASDNNLEMWRDRGRGSSRDVNVNVNKDRNGNDE